MIRKAKMRSEEKMTGATETQASSRSKAALRKVDVRSMAPRHVILGSLCPISSPGIERIFILGRRRCT